MPPYLLGILRKVFLWPYVQDKLVGVNIYTLHCPYLFHLHRWIKKNVKGQVHRKNNAQGYGITTWQNRPERQAILSPTAYFPSITSFPSGQSCSYFSFNKRNELVKWIRTTLNTTILNWCPVASAPASQHLKTWSLASLAWWKGSDWRSLTTSFTQPMTCYLFVAGGKQNRKWAQFSWNWYMGETINIQINEELYVEICYQEKGKSAIQENNEPSHDLERRRSLGKPSTTKWKLKQRLENWGVK